MRVRYHGIEVECERQRREAESAFGRALAESLERITANFLVLINQRIVDIELETADKPTIVEEK